MNAHLFDSDWDYYDQFQKKEEDDEHADEAPDGYYDED
jgi:hypothetical protein